MLLKLEHPKLFSDMIGIISEMVLEVKIKVSKEGMSLVAVDPANVAMIMFKMPVAAFSQIEVEEEVLGVSLESLKSVLRRCSVGSSLIMQTQEQVLKIQIHDKIKREFDLALIEVEAEDKKIPDLEFANRVIMQGIDLQEAVEDCLIVADSCGFETSENKFIISAQGNLNAAKVEFSSDEVEIESTQDSRSKYSLEYLQKMVKATKRFEKVGVNFSNDYPLKLEFKTPLAELSFILAPRVETED